MLDVTFRNIDAYGVETEVGVTYQFSKKLRLSIFSLGGLIHRDESSWMSTGNSYVKYPRNDTKIFMFTIMGQWQF